jgi:hypothetical protein
MDMRLGYDLLTVPSVIMRRNSSVAKRNREVLLPASTAIHYHALIGCKYYSTRMPTELVLYELVLVDM